MNTIQILAAQSWVERLGWTLLHFLWQGILIAVLYAAARKWMSHASPNARYLLASAALVTMAVAPVITWSALLPASEVSAPAASHFATTAGANTTAVGTGAVVSLRLGVSRSVTGDLLPWVVAAWLAGAVACWVRLLGGWVWTLRLRSRLVHDAPSEWQQALDRLKSTIRVSRPVRLLVSALVETPAVVGWLRPVVLVPVGALAGLPSDHVEALLLHELAHIRRHDYAINVLQNVIEALLFYHPAVWWISGHMRTERELCCDDTAVAHSADALVYVRALAELEAARPAHLRTAMAANGDSLANRIARLLGHPRTASRTLAGQGTVAAAMLAAITALAVFAQPAPRPKFEVASIKPSQEQRFQMVRPQPGRLTANASVQLLIQNAYTMQPFQIIGAPGWVNSERFEIEAKADGKASRAELLLMLQPLLEERFQLKVHRETRELPVYALVAAKSGIKLPAPKDGSCVEPSPDEPNGWAGGRMAPPSPGQMMTSPRCGSVNVMLEMTGARMRGGKIAMPELQRILAMVLGRPVIDKTGFTKLFDVGLDFMPDEITEAMPPRPPGAPANPNDSPTILAALQEQMGLKLETTKGPVEVIVVDHVERPSGN